MKKISLRSETIFFMLGAPGSGKGTYSKMLSKDLNLNVLGLMCIPPVNSDSEQFFRTLKELNIKNGLKDLSMGMSADYKLGIKYGSNFVRIGSAIFK